MRALHHSLLAPAALAAAVTMTPVASAQLTLPRVSPNATLSQTIGMTTFTITYSRPAVRGRTVWGEVVPYDKPWRTGANEATSFTCSSDIKVNGQTLPAGTYSFFTIPTAGEWTVVFSKQKELWGTNEYDPAQDQLRVKTKAEPAEHREWLELGFEDMAPSALPQSPSSGKLVIRWEKVAVPISIETDMAGLAVAAVNMEMGKLKADDWRTPMRGATFCLDNGLDLAQAQTWAEKSVAIQENYQNLSLLAKVHAKAGRTKEAVAAGKKAVKLGKESKDKVDTSATEKLVAEWTEKK